MGLECLVGAGEWLWVRGCQNHEYCITNTIGKHATSYRQVVVGETAAIVTVLDICKSAVFACGRGFKCKRDITLYEYH